MPMGTQGWEGCDLDEGQYISKGGLTDMERTTMKQLGKGQRGAAVEVKNDTMASLENDRQILLATQFLDCVQQRRMNEETTAVHKIGINIYAWGDTGYSI